MNHDLDPMADLDRRATAAAEDLRALAARRPVPPLDVDRIPTPAPTESTRSRRPLAIAAAILLVLGVAGGAAALIERRGDDGTARANTVQPARPFVAGWLPDGLSVGGVFSLDDQFVVDEPRFLADLHVYGSDGAAVVGIGTGPALGDLSADVDGDGELSEDELPDRVVVDGVDVWHIRPYEGVEWSVVEQGERTIVVLAPSLTVAERDAVAAGSSIDADQLAVEPAVVEDWTLLAVLADGMDSYPISAWTRYGSSVEHQAVYYGPAGSTGATVSSGAADSDAVLAMPLLVSDHRQVTVRGHDAVLVSFPTGGVPSTLISVTWQERAGEQVAVGGTGLSEDEVLRIAEDVRPADTDEWSELVRDTRLGRLSDTVNKPGATVEELGFGELPGGVLWRLTWTSTTADAQEDQFWDLGLDLDLNVPGADSSGSSGWKPAAPFGDAISVGSGGRYAGAGLIVDAEVAAVRIERADGSVVAEATVLVAGDRRAWFAELPEDDLVAVAVDASGSELGRTSLPRTGDSIVGSTEATIPGTTVPCTFVEGPAGSASATCDAVEPAGDGD